MHVAKSLSADENAQEWAFLHLRSFKTPPSGAVMSDEDDADCAFSMRKGVKSGKVDFAILFSKVYFIKV